MSVKCPECQVEQSKVLDSRHRGNGTRRRRECFNGHRFTTFETIVPSNTRKYTVQVMVHQTVEKKEVNSSVTIGAGRPAKKPRKKTIDDLNDRQRASLDRLRQKIRERKNEQEEAKSATHS